MKLQKWLEDHLERPFCQVEINRAEMWCPKKRNRNKAKIKRALFARH